MTDPGPATGVLFPEQTLDAVVAAIERFEALRFDPAAGRANASDHPAGLALDLMVGRGIGERVAEYIRANRERLGVEYVIYRQRIDTGSGWERMPDRGGATANHMDHVHISFEA